MHCGIWDFMLEQKRALGGNDENHIMWVQGDNSAGCSSACRNSGQGTSWFPLQASLSTELRVTPKHHWVWPPDNKNVM